MKKFKYIIYIISFGIIQLPLSSDLFAQGYGAPLTFQGVDNFTNHSAAARAAGNISIGAKEDIALMFHNPATLQSLTSIQVSLGGLYFNSDTKQEQNYAPVRYYSNFSLLMEGLTGLIPSPPPDTGLFPPLRTAADTVQRPYDNLGPNWSRSDNDRLPVQAMLAVPVTFENFKIVAGIGAVEYANLNHYYQNNNVLSPSILSHRPLPILRPTDDNPLEVEWSQQIRSRKGSIQGYGLALAGKLEKYNLSVGFSAMHLTGSSDDFERTMARGNLTFYFNAFRNDSVYSLTTKNGTSDFSGQEYTISSILNSRYVSIGFSLKLPTTITRSYSIKVATDTTGSPAHSEIRGEDELKLRWRGMLGLSLTPKENLRIGLEYDFRPYESVRYANESGAETSPWLPASLFRVGVEYTATPWLALRGGMRGEAEIFQPEGNKIEGDPVTYTVYSVGLGATYAGLRLNIAYENSLMKYQDIWSTAVSKNSERQHMFIADLSYEIPWNW
jgi:opacity protein-like surface antigen